MSNLAEKFNIPPALFEAIKKMNAEETEYQMKVKALMKKKGITSLGQLSPEEKKEFFNTLDAMHKAKNEEVELDEEFAGWIAMYNGQKLEIKKTEAKDLYSAKLKAIAHFKVPKSKQGLVAIKSAYNEEIELDESMSKSPTSLMPGYDERAARFMARQAKGTLVKGSAQSAKQKEGGMKPKKEMKKEEVEEANDPQKSMKRAGLSVARAKEVMRHRKEIGSIRKKREALRNSFDPVSAVLEAYKKNKMKKEATANDNNKSFKSGEKMSGKTEPIEINPELKEQKS
jgi:hypothetical protein